MSTTTSAPAGSLRPARTTTVTLGNTAVTYDDRDRTRPYVVLHGGGGPFSVRGFAGLLAERTHSRVLVPTHPGFAGTTTHAGVTTRDLAATYVGLIEELKLSDVTVIGNSFGGWLAAEMALLDSPRISGAVIVDGIGIEVEAHPMTDVSGLLPADLAKLSWHDPSKAPKSPATGGSGPSPDVAALIGYGGPTTSDPTLLQRLSGVQVPVHIVWGESDGIVTPDYGKAYAAAIPMSEFTLLPRAGHLPQLETPEELLGALLDLGR